MLYTFCPPLCPLAAVQLPDELGWACWFSWQKEVRTHVWQQHGVMLAEDANDLTFVICCLFSCPLLKQEIFLWMIWLEILMFVSLCIYEVVLPFVGKAVRFMPWSLEMLHHPQQGEGFRVYCWLHPGALGTSHGPRLCRDWLTRIKSANICSETAWEVNLRRGENVQNIAWQKRKTHSSYSTC